MSASTLEARLEKLESLEAIRQLKARYLASCDNKQPENVRSCFADGDVDIDFGVVGQFKTADALVEIYTQIACHPHMLEMHHGVNPQLDIVDAQFARGRWGLHYQLINTDNKTLTKLSGEYRDEYRHDGQAWKISASHFTVKSTLVLQLGEDAISSLVIGAA